MDQNPLNVFGIRDRRHPPLGPRKKSFSKMTMPAVNHNYSHTTSKNLYSDHHQQQGLELQEDFKNVEFRDYGTHSKGI